MYLVYEWFYGFSKASQLEDKVIHFNVDLLYTIYVLKMYLVINLQIYKSLFSTHSLINRNLVFIYEYRITSNSSLGDY